MQAGFVETGEHCRLHLKAGIPKDCPSSTWVQFQDSCYLFLQEAIKVESIEDVRNQCVDQDESFKWFDKSSMTFAKWTDQDDGEDLVDTCAFLHTKTGEWKKGNCEISSVEGTLCKAAIPYEKKYLSDNHILISALVIASTVILTVLGAIIWFLYKRNSDSGFITVFSAAPESPYNDDCVLVVAEENVYAVQFE
ncbi:PREDICTED: CD302 antigen [Elephantulus edwardii]|uniref:CD302 antigen n=1 Tax=Elephantulus edwardii TaxID=28737 RepID=UPI0003F09DD6|nr:PREDICTED: CD302 antigen [Elephantulus edwardii]